MAKHCGKSADMDFIDRPALRLWWVQVFRWQIYTPISLR